MCVSEFIEFYLNLHAETLECYAVGEACCVRHSVKLRKRENFTITYTVEVNSVCQLYGVIFVPHS